MFSMLAANVQKRDTTSQVEKRPSQMPNGNIETMLPAPRGALHRVAWLGMMKVM